MQNNNHFFIYCNHLTINNIRSMSLVMRSSVPVCIKLCIYTWNSGVVNIFLVQIIGIVTFIDIHFSMVYLKNTVDKMMKEIPVVTYDYYCSLKFPERLEQYFTACNIQVVCRLVENQEVDWLGQKTGKHTPAFLPSRKDSQFIAGIIPAELE